MLTDDHDTDMMQDKEVTSCLFVAKTGTLLGYKSYFSQERVQTTSNHTVTRQQIAV